MGLWTIQFEREEKNEVSLSAELIAEALKSNYIERESQFPSHFDNYK